MSETMTLNRVAQKQRSVTHGWTLAEAVYAVLMAFNLLSYLWLLAVGAEINTVPIVIWMTRLLSVPLALCLGKLWKDKSCWILGVYFIWLVIRLCVPSFGNLFQEEAAESMLSAVWVFTACYGLGKALEWNKLKKLLLIVAFFWIAGIVVYSCVGIYTAWTEHWFYGPRNGYINIWTGRLEIIYLASTTGGILAVSVLVGLIPVLCSVKKGIRLFFAASEVPIILALALTDSRTAYITIAAGFGMAFAIKAYHKAVLQNRNTGKRNLLFIAETILIFVVVILILMQITPLFNWGKTRGLIPRALAEGQTKRLLDHRGFIGEGISNGRAALWTKIARYLIHNPRVLLLGESKLTPLRNIVETKAHCHNIFLQVLVESGILGLALVLLFIGRLVFQGVRMVRGKGTQLWIKLLPAIIVPLLIGDLFECFIWVRSSYMAMVAVFFIAAGIVGRAGGKTVWKG